MNHVYSFLRRLNSHQIDFGPIDPSRAGFEHKNYLNHTTRTCAATDEKFLFALMPGIRRLRVIDRVLDFRPGDSMLGNVSEVPWGPDEAGHVEESIRISAER